MHVIIAGSSGYIGSALVDTLLAAGHRVTRLVRHQTESSVQTAKWEPYRDQIDLSVIEGSDAIINLAGENVATRWTVKKKQEILASRVKSTALLARAVTSVEKPPKIFISASAIGYYGNSGAAWVDESSPQGSGFLAGVVKQWEEAAHVLQGSQTRLVYPRFGLVLGRKGGALKKMLPAFRLGVAGRLGSGEQFMSWIALEDLLSGLLFCLNNHSLEGRINFTAPNPVTNREFTQMLAYALNRPAVVPIPSALLQLIFGEMAGETLLASTRVRPSKLLSSGFQFQHPVLDKFLQQECA